jgi:outer membrane autotransporter protein
MAQVFCPGPAATQVSPVPPGLVLPPGATIKIWESGATDFSQGGTVNRILAYKNGYFSEVPETYYAPFPANQGVPAIMPSQPVYFVRMYAPAAGINQVGSWVMRAADVRGLTPGQIRDRFALPTVPTNITMVVVPPNVAALWTGYAGAILNPPWGRGGGQQTYIMSRLTTYYYNQANPALPLTDYTNNGGVYYNYISTANYLHGQALGAQAMLYKPTVGGGNAGQVAGYLDQFIPRAYSDLENVYTLLDYLNYSGYGPGPLKAAMKQISPERYDALSTLGLRANLLFGDALMQRNQALRLGLAGGSGEQTAAALPEGLGRLAQLAYVCSFSDPRMVSPGMLPSQVSQRGIGIWARGVGEFGNQGSFGERTGFVYNTGGVAGGIDWQPRQEVILGFGTAYLGTGLNWDQSGGNADVNYAKFGLYGSYFTPRWFVDGVFSGGINWASTQRNITILSDTPLIPGVSRVATSSQTGHDLMVQCRGGVNFSLWNWSLTPMAGLAYFYLHQNPFEEQGADSLNLNVSVNEAQTLRSTLGTRLARTFAAPSGNKVIPEVSIGWAHDFTLDNRVINASLAEVGGAFATNGFNSDTDSFLAGAGITAQLTNGVALSGRYNAEIGRSFTSHMVNLGLRYEF